MEQYKRAIKSEMIKMLIGASVLLVLFGTVFIYNQAYILVVVYALIGAVYLWDYHSRDTKYVNKYIRRKNLDIEVVMDDVFSGVKRGTALLGEKYIMTFYQRRTLMEYEDVMWIYRSTRRKLYNNCIVTIVDNNHGRNEALVPSEEEADLLIAQVVYKCPYVLQGYSKEIQRTYLQDYSTFCYVVEQRKLANYNPYEG